MKLLKVLFLSLFISFSVCGQEKEAFVNEYFRLLREGFLGLELGDMIKAAFLFIHTPYVGGTLEVNDEEQLVVNFSEMDCTTYVETVLALARSNQKENPTYEDFVRELENIRYRNGEIDGYTSRLHYISEWIVNNEEEGLIENITCEIGGEDFRPKVDYMSKHPHLYKSLKGRPQEIKKMKQVEQLINENDELCFIPCEAIDDSSSFIKDGDIIFFTTSIAGLDVQHAGIALWNEGYLSFIHASSKAKKVILEPQPLDSYCNKQKTITGIIVVRPVL